MQADKSKQEEIKLITVGDRELWVVSGEDWKMPVYVDTVHDSHEKKYAYVTRAGYYKASWYEAVSSVLNSLTIDATGQWIIPMETFVAAATKAQGVTPSYYIVWNGRREVPHNTIKKFAVEASDSNEDMPAFVSYMASENSIFSNNQLSLMFTLFRECAIKWLLYRKRTLDLGFVRLNALPLRVNWKQMLDAWISPAIAHVKCSQRNQFLMQHGFDDIIMDTRLLAMEPKTIKWNVECTTTSEWYKNSQTYEHNRMHRGPASYVDHVRSAIMAVRSQIVETYMHWVKEKMDQTGRVAEGGEDGGWGLRQNPSVLDRSPDYCPRCARNLAGYTGRIKKRRRKRSLIPQAEEMHEVSVLQQGTQDVRDGWAAPTDQS